MTTLETLTTKALDTFPQYASRITKGAALVAQGHVTWLPSGNFKVMSQTDTSRAYVVDRKHQWHCGCPDQHVLKGFCKHAWASMIAAKLKHAA